MILLDENIVSDQADLLRRRRVHFRHIGHDFLPQGIQDDDILSVLHRLRRPTLFTRDLRLYRPDLCHDGYCIVCLDVGRSQVAEYVRILLRTPQYATAAGRMGIVATISPAVIRAWRRHAGSETFHALP